MYRLHNPLQRYDWGSVTAIPAFVGAEPDGRPVAEMWLGAHPSAPSRLAHGAPLDAEIALCLAGEVVLDTGDTKFALPRGSAVFVPPGSAPEVSGAGRLAVARVGG